MSFWAARTRSVKTSFWAAPAKKDLRRVKHVKDFCALCLKEFSFPPSKRRLYCSYECQDEALGGPLEVRMERMLKRSQEKNSCWLWLGATNESGYGTVSVDGKTKLAHRQSYILHKGPIPTGLLICHTCDVRTCCNPEHLYAGTHEDNMRDVRLRDRKSTSQASWLQRVDMVREYRANKVLLVTIASRYGVEPAYIKTWDRKFEMADGTFGFEQLLTED